MNANELADELEKVMCVYYDQETNQYSEEEGMSEIAATMLRQQHTSLISDVDVIERLTKEIKVKDEAIFNSEKQAYNLAMQVQNQKSEIEALKAEIVSIEKNTDYWADKANWIKNNKPVAWMYQDGEVILSRPLKDEVGIPLYSHPVKELTDKLDELLCSILGEYYVGGEKEALLAEEIRAILRKAQEK